MASRASQLTKMTSLKSRSTETNHDVIVKLLLIGDSGVGKSCLLLRYADDTFTSRFNQTIGVDCKVRKLMISNKLVKLQVWDTAGQERFRTITQAYYRGAMGVLIVYDVTNRTSFNNVQGWLRVIGSHAPDDVNKILVGNKTDMADNERVVTCSEGQALAEEFSLQFFETSAKANTNVNEVFNAIAVEVVQRLDCRDQLFAGGAFSGSTRWRSGPAAVSVGPAADSATKKSKCCS